MKKNKNDKKLGEHIFVLNEDKQQLSFLTEFFMNESGPYTSQSLCFQSNSNGISFDIFKVSVTPALLRQFADELELQESKVVV